MGDSRWRISVQHLPTSNAGDVAEQGTRLRKIKKNKQSMKNNWLKRRVTIDMSGVTEHDLDTAFEEAVKLLKEGYLSGLNGNDTGNFTFKTETPDE